MSLPLDPIPNDQSLIELKEGQPAQIIDQRWYRWIEALVRRVLTNAPLTAARVFAVRNSALTATTLYTPTQQQMFRVHWFVHIEAADAVSSSATVTLSWKTNGVACSRAYAAITGNTTATTGDGTLAVYADSAQPIQVAVAYASNTPGAMTYRLVTTVEQLT